MGYFTPLQLGQSFEKLQPARFHPLSLQGLSPSPDLPDHVPVVGGLWRGQATAFANAAARCSRPNGARPHLASSTDAL
jgi:hypothetical protein